MNIKEIKSDVFDLLESEHLKYTDVSDVLDILSDLIYQNGKIADILIINGKKRSKKIDSKKGLKCHSTAKQQK